MILVVGYNLTMQGYLFTIPPEVSRVTGRLEEAGFEAWVVGGCVRDLFLQKIPKDWDITTNATPEDIQSLFENTFYTNDFGTVGVVNDDVSSETHGEHFEALRVVEITPYRTEGKYSDSRRPDNVVFSQKLEDDLTRRDFTINAMVYSPSTGEIQDHFGGIKDLKDGILRAVGKPEERFNEDALRILRAVRISAEHGFTIEPSTKEAMRSCAFSLSKISKERIRDEFIKVINSRQPREALLLALELGILPYIASDLEEGIGVEQNQAHSFDVFEHNTRSLQHAADKGWSLLVRLAALFHDIGKPKSRRWSEEKHDWTFHGHEVVGARITKRALEALKFSRETVDTVEKLVRWHMFFSDPDKITLSAVRRIIVHVGTDNIENLISLRICDRIGTGRPKEQPFRLRKYQAMIAQALRDPISVGMLKVDGKSIMTVTQETPGPRVGWILHALLEEVLDNPERNTVTYLETQAIKLSGLTDIELRELGKGGKERQAQEEEASVRDIQKKFHVS